MQEEEHLVRPHYGEAYGKEYVAPPQGTDRPNGNGRTEDTDLYQGVDPVSEPEANGLSETVAVSEATAPEEKPARNLRPLLVEIIQTVLLTLIIFAGVRSVVQNFKVDGASMEPTLHTGQYLLINKVSYVKIDGLALDFAQQAGLAPLDSSSYYPLGGPQRGDIAVFRYPGGPERDFIKRVIGVPGDTVQIDRGRVYVNGSMLDEDYIRAVPSYSVPSQKVPEGQYFVLGDNRPNSSDSHIWGFVPEDNMIGKAWVSYWPPNDWGSVPNRGIASD